MLSRRLSRRLQVGTCGQHRESLPITLYTRSKCHRRTFPSGPPCRSCHYHAEYRSKAPAHLHKLLSLVSVDTQCGAFLHPREAMVRRRWMLGDVQELWKRAGSDRRARGDKSPRFGGARVNTDTVIMWIVLEARGGHVEGLLCLYVCLYNVHRLTTRGCSKKARTATLQRRGTLCAIERCLSRWLD